nr:unnamed protein product [Digitaria exilis]
MAAVDPCSVVLCQSSLHTPELCPLGVVSSLALMRRVLRTFSSRGDGAGWRDAAARRRFFDRYLGVTSPSRHGGAIFLSRRREERARPTHPLPLSLGTYRIAAPRDGRKKLSPVWALFCCAFACGSANMMTAAILWTPGRQRAHCSPQRTYPQGTAGSGLPWWLPGRRRGAADLNSASAMDHGSRPSPDLPIEVAARTEKRVTPPPPPRPRLHTRRHTSRLMLPPRHHLTHGAVAGAHAVGWREGAMESATRESEGASWEGAATPSGDPLPPSRAPWHACAPCALYCRCQSATILLESRSSLTRPRRKLR